MSDIFGSIIGDAAAGFALFSQSGRSIGDIIPDVVIDETNRDTGVLTQHPVETGTPVSDHYYTMGPLYELRCGWSDSTVGPGYTDEIYQRLQSLMATHKPFNVTSGKRQYTDMMFLSLAVRTDVESEYALMVSAVMQKCIMVDVSTTGAGSGATPATTNGASSVGTASGIAANNAVNAGFATDGKGNVAFSNSVSPGGTVAMSGPLSGGADSISGVSTTGGWGSFSGGGVVASPAPAPTLESTTTTMKLEAAPYPSDVTGLPPYP